MLCRVKLDKDKTELEKSRLQLAKDKTELEKMRLEVMLQAHSKSEDRARASSRDIRAITEANENRAADAFRCMAGIKNETGIDANIIVNAVQGLAGVPVFSLHVHTCASLSSYAPWHALFLFVSFDTCCLSFRYR